MDHPQATTIVWGPGFEGYLHNLSMSENLRQRFPCGQVHLVFNWLGAPFFRFSLFPAILVLRHTSLTVGVTGSFSDASHADLRLYHEWLEYQPCPGQVLFEEVSHIAVRLLPHQGG